MLVGKGARNLHRRYRTRYHSPRRPFPRSSFVREDSIVGTKNRPEKLAAIHPAVADARAVLFDFDFTLADSSGGVVICVNHALSRLGLPESPGDAIARTIGLDLTTALAILAGEEQRPRGDEFLEHFRWKADEVMVDGTFFLPGAGPVLKTLHAAGYPLGIVSTKGRRRIEAALDRDGLRGTIEVIVGGDDVSRYKPDPEGLNKAAGLMGIPTGQCVYVGDSEVDARAAEAAGMPFIPVLSGTTPSGTLGEYPCRAVLSGVQEIIAGAQQT